MNVSYVKTKTYEQKPMNCEPTKQTQSSSLLSASEDPPKLYAKAGVFEGPIENRISSIYTALHSILCGDILMFLIPMDLRI